jgi:hypothetical protein
VTRLCLYAAAMVAFVVGGIFVGAATAAAPPAPTITSEPAAVTRETTATFSFTDSDSTVTFRCQLDGGGFTPCATGVTYMGLANGPHTFDVKAVDVLLNESTVTSYAWTVDTTPPPPPGISGPPNPSNSTSATFSFTDVDPTVSFHCNLDGHGFPSCSNPVTFGNLAATQHTLSAIAVDPAGNESTRATYTWVIDTTPPPQPTIVSGPAHPSGTSEAQFAFSDSEGGVGFRCQLDGSNFLPCANPQAYAGLPDGTHTFSVEAVDAAGNTSDPTPAYSWLIDTVHPVVTLTDKPPTVTNRTSASFSFTANKAGSTFQCSLDGHPFAACASPVVYANLADASHTFAVRATQLGNTGPPTSYTWIVDTIPPDTTLVSAPPGDSNSASAVFTFRSNEPGSTFVCSLDAGGFDACSSPKTYGNADSTPASYTWRISGVGPATADHTPPGNVRGLRQRVGYGVLRLSWSRPPDADFDHIGIFVSTSAKAPARVAVYRGSASAYTAKHFRNGFYSRYTVISYDRAGNASRGVSAVVAASALLRMPADGARVRNPPRLLWTGTPGATFYNVQLYRGSQKVLSTWPRKSAVQLATRWTYGGHPFRWKNGSYRWYVWPAFGPRRRFHYGQLLGQASFTFTSRG